MLFIRYEAKCNTGISTEKRYFAVDVHTAAVADDAMLEAVNAALQHDFREAEIVGCSVINGESYWGNGGVGLCDRQRVVSSYAFRRPVKFVRVHTEYERAAT